jgi:hypothetical protein
MATHSFTLGTADIPDRQLCANTGHLHYLRHWQSICQWLLQRELILDALGSTEVSYSGTRDIFVHQDPARRTPHSDPRGSTWRPGPPSRRCRPRRRAVPIPPLPRRKNGFTETRGRFLLECRLINHVALVAARPEDGRETIVSGARGAAWISRGRVHSH